MLPGLFYLVAAPFNDRTFLAMVAIMVVGLVWGALMDVAIYAVFRNSRAPDPNPRLDRP